MNSGIPSARTGPTFDIADIEHRGVRVELRIDPNAKFAVVADDACSASPEAQGDPQDPAPVTPGGREAMISCALSIRGASDIEVSRGWRKRTASRAVGAAEAEHEDLVARIVVR